jgi:hypothetical protein
VYSSKCLPVTALGAGDIPVNKTKILAFVDITSQWERNTLIKSLG